MVEKRKIKFRVWDTELKMMTHFSKWHFNSEYGLLAFYAKEEGERDWGIGDMPHKKENCIIMQYTGLKDKNGKEIFCNDMLSHPDVPNSEFYVRWSNERAKFQLESKEGKELMGQLFDNEYFVIGNEFEGIA